MFQANFISAKRLLDWNIEYQLDLKTQSLKKGEHVLEAGQRCDYLYFVLKGILRLYYYDIEGNQMTHWFSRENSIITSPFSFFKGEENILYLEALEDTEILLVSASQLKKINKNVEQAEFKLRKLYAEYAMAFSRRIMDIHTRTAEERYLKLLSEHPYLFQKAKLAHIASYLGITQQSLSRIRKNI